MFTTITYIQYVFETHTVYTYVHIQYVGHLPFGSRGWKRCLLYSPRLKWPVRKHDGRGFHVSAITLFLSLFLFPRH